MPVSTVCGGGERVCVCVCVRVRVRVRVCVCVGVPAGQAHGSKRVAVRGAAPRGP